ncbi:MAG: helix-turn-helix transcriptional regulator [Pedobacter sp.]
MKHIETISEFHQFRKLPKPEHPMISIIDIASVEQSNKDEPIALLLNFYVIAMKKVSGAKMKYGQQQFDFDEGLMSFIAPNQVFGIVPAKENEEIKQSGWVLIIHPDFLWNTPLARTIKQYDFWDYSVNESLFLSEKEEATINQIIQNIQQEYRANIDKFSKQIIISQLESLLNYADRYYNRQFITREKSNHQILDRLNILVSDYFNGTDLINKGLPSVRFIAEALNISPKYLSSLLKMLTGQSTQQYIHERLIAKAKEQLSTTNLSVSEIAYQLGFEHLQSFSKLFKTKTKLSPLEFRQSFN